MFPAIVTKTFCFDGGPDHQKEKIDAIKQFASDNGVAIDQFHQYADSFIFQMHGVEETIKRFNDDSFTFIQIGSPKWKYEFEMPNEILVDIMPHAEHDKKALLRIIELKIGKKLHHVDGITYSYIKPSETRRTFETRMKKELALVDHVFYHEGHPCHFSMIATFAPRLQNNTLEV